MTEIQEVDMQHCIAVVRPGSAYHWRGEGQYGNDLSAIGEWRDSGTSPPTEQELVAAWETVIVPQQLSEQTYRQDIRGRFLALVGRPLTDLSNAELKDFVEALAITVGAIDLQTGLIQRPPHIEQ